MNHEKIRQLREARGLTQAKAAKEAGMNSAQHWSNIERGHQDSDSITVGLLDRMAAALGVDPRELHQPTAKRKGTK